MTQIFANCYHGARLCLRVIVLVTHHVQQRSQKPEFFFSPDKPSKLSMVLQVDNVQLSEIFCISPKSYFLSELACYTPTAPKIKHQNKCQQCEYSDLMLKLIMLILLAKPLPTMQSLAQTTFSTVVCRFMHVITSTVFRIVLKIHVSANKRTIVKLQCITSYLPHILHTSRT